MIGWGEHNDEENHGVVSCRVHEESNAIVDSAREAW